MKSNKSKFLIIGLSVILAIAIITTVWLKNASHKKLSLQAQKEMTQYLKELSKSGITKPKKDLAAPYEDVHYLKGRQHYYKKEFDQAILEFTESIKTKPTAEVYCELGISYMEKGDFNAAIENLKRSIELKGQYPKAEYAMAVCYTRINPPDTKSAREHLEKAKKLGYQIPEWFEKHLAKLETAK